MAKSVLICDDAAFMRVMIKDILTKNGYGDMVVMSYEEYQNIQYDMMVMRELRAAEMESENTTERFTHDKVMTDIRDRIKAVSSTHV